MEHSIIIIKPHQDIDEISNIVEDQIFKNGLSIIKKIRIQFTEKEIDICFASKIERSKFIRYMTSDYVNVYLVKGIYAISKAKKIKKSIRYIFGVDKDVLRNVVHTSDEGMEYYIQFTTCFPEFSIARYCGYADLDVRVDEKNFDNVLRIIENQNIDCVAAITYERNFVDHITIIKSENVYYGCIHYFAYGEQSYDVVSYSRVPIIQRDFATINQLVEESIRYEGFVALRNQSINGYTKKFLNYIKDTGVKAAFATPASNSLFLSRNLQEYLECSNFIPIHGSGYGILPSSITVSQKTFESLLYN